MADTVIILGAGASRRSGVPTMAEFLDEASRLERTGEIGSDNEWEDSRAEGIRAFKRVLTAQSALQRVHSKAWIDIHNVEHVFAAFEMAQTLDKFPDDDVNVGELSPEMKRVIVRTVEETLQYPLDDRKVHPPESYVGLAGLATLLREEARPKQDVSVVTFNYDLGADYALSWLGLGPDYGFREDDSDDQNDGFVPLLKLHGSINWRYCDECGAITPYSVEDFIEEDDLAEQDINDASDSVRLRVGSRVGTTYCQNHTGARPFSEIPVIVPPTWSKSKGRESIEEVWQTAAEELTDTENIFVFGYSLPPSDAFFQQLYALGTVGERRLQRFWVFNPDESGAVEKRFRNLLGHGAESRFQYHTMNFQEGLSYTLKEMLGEVPDKFGFLETPGYTPPTVQMPSIVPEVPTFSFPDFSTGGE